MEANQMDSAIWPEQFDFDDGIEELTDFKVIKPKRNRSRQLKRHSKNVTKENNKKQKVCSIDSTSNTDNGLQDELDMSSWDNCFVPEPILYALKELRFHKPTPIQELVIPTAIRDHQDILGAAETGSGKTLAFGIPIVSHIIAANEREKVENNLQGTKPLQCLVLTPTRELAIQVKNHLQAITKYTEVKVAVVVGGMCPEKQRRILRKCPDIVIATPGRLWELIEEGEEHLSDVSMIQYLVIDEADRMVEKGHFQELTEILQLVNGGKIKHPRQTFVFSATLSLEHEAPKRFAQKKKRGPKQKQKLESFVDLIGMKDKPKIIDITRKTALVETLTESQIKCEIEEKDMYLYYFLLTYPGRTLVFNNSIDCVRRLRTILEHLGCNPLPLHASMPQRQRLKNLEKFESSKLSVLLATDVAARGLDIKGIEHVIHYQVPRTAEIYVHRSGRTARAQNEGFSLMLIDPQDVIYYKRICNTLNKDKALPPFPVDHNIVKVLKERVTIAHSIDKMEHRMQRLMAQNRWFLHAAKEMEIEIDDRNLLNDLGDSREQATKLRQIKTLKKQLNLLLNKPIIPKRFTGSYPTKSGKLLVSSTKGSEKAIQVMANVNVSATRKKKKKVVFRN